MSNKEFLEKFEFYKKNPNDYKYKIKSYGLVILMLFLVMTIGFGTTVATILDDEESNLYMNYLWTFFVFGVLFTFSISFLESFLNRKITKFNNMIYKGLISDLFPNIEHPVINYYKEQIRADIRYKGGITGETAYKIYQGFTDNEIIHNSTTPSIEQQAIDEIARVHCLKRLEID